MLAEEAIQAAIKDY